jgi:hypothetical protein
MIKPFASCSRCRQTTARFSREAVSAYAAQPVALLVGPRLLLRAVENRLCERHVRGEPLQELDKFGRERARLRRIEEEAAFRATVIE